MCSVSTSAPATAAHTGSTPERRGGDEADEREPEHGERERGQRARRRDGAARAARARARSLNERESTTHSTAIAASQGSAISAAKRVNESPLASNASRLVRFETGSSSEALLARCVHAYTCGRGLKRSRAAVANTTGVSRTTVASRLSTAVVAAATANTSPSSRRGSPRAPPAIAAPR